MRVRGYNIYSKIITVYKIIAIKLIKKLCIIKIDKVNSERATSQ